MDLCVNSASIYSQWIQWIQLFVLLVKASLLSLCSECKAAPAAATTPAAVKNCRNRNFLRVAVLIPLHLFRLIRRQGSHQFMKGGGWETIFAILI
ncbi:unnamed protein product [Albugo candida]|uniref:Secreted protein n=1 Tax=Albugo candida TaxID=65357 RepID=A0A024FYL3_9STRA|nr:unnamed protein product [Albugo candida]|eukprot:CCI11764.1 unnamed protein product [Albugo candida]